MEKKSNLAKSDGALIKKIEEWITSSPHVYLTKWWTNELLRTSSSITWDFYQLDHQWPASFYSTFEKDKVDPINGLVEILTQLISTDISISTIQESHIKRESNGTDVESLKKLYTRLVYSKNNIESDTKPGDVFKINDKYYLNIRPECDTTQRIDDNPELYLLEGNPPINLDDEVEYIGTSQSRIKEKIYQLFMLHLDGNNIIIFDKRKLSIRKLKDAGKKVCRISHPFISYAVHEFSSYLGRIGKPRYPDEIVSSIFSVNENQEE